MKTIELATPYRILRFLFVFSALLLIESIESKAIAESLQWEVVHSEPKEEFTMVRGLDDVAYGNGIYVAVGDTNFVSLDGKNWSAAGSFQPNLTRVIYASGKFVAVGGGWIRSGDGEKSIIAVSTNGFDWMPVLSRKLQTSRGKDGSTALFLTDVVYANGKFIAVGSGSGKMLLMSEDAISWTEVETDMLPICNRIAFGNGIFVGIGTGTMTSADGVNWIQSPSSEENQLFNLFSLTFGGGRFVAAGGGGAIWESSNGVDWTKKWSKEGVNMHGVAYGAGEYIAVGSSESTLVMRDSESDTWKSSSEIQPFEMWGAAYGNGYLIVVGENNGIMRARVDLATSLNVPEQDFQSGFKFTLQSKPRCEYRIEYSDGLSGWTVLTNVTSMGSTLTISDPSSLTQGGRFYRAVVE